MFKKMIFLTLLACCMSSRAQTDSIYSKREVIYGRKDGMALTLFVGTPKKPNGKAIIYVASGGYFSSVDWLPDIANRMATQLFKRGYTVFFVFHGSAPVYSGTDVIDDIQKAVQFVRFHAADYKIDPNHIGCTGTSAGGNLSLLMSVTESRSVSEKATPLEKTSSRVQAVACFFPPTDFLNFGKPNHAVTDDPDMLVKNGLKSPFTFNEYVPETNSLQLVTDKAKIDEVLRQMSPAQLVDKTAPPTLICHGDADLLVPLSQSENYIEKLKKLGVPAKLVIKKGGAHGWPKDDLELSGFADWFDTYLK